MLLHRIVEIEQGLAVQEWWLLGRALPEARLMTEIISLLAVARGELFQFLADFFGRAPLGFDPAWPAAAGALVLALCAPRARAAEVARAIDLPLLGFVLGLGVIVRAVTAHGLGDAIGGLVPAGDGLGALLVAAAVAAVLANLLNNLPALLVLLPAAAASGPAVVLAVLIGVNAGPNLTYTGSLATLLWRRVLHAHDTDTDVAEFTRLGVLVVPATLLATTVALWIALLV